MALGDGLKHLLHEGVVAGSVDAAGLFRAHCAAGTTDGDAMLLEVERPVCRCSGLDTVANLHTAGGEVAEDIPPFWLEGECGVGDAGNEAGYFEEVVDLGQIGVWEGVAYEAAQDAAGCQRTSCQDCFSDLAGWSVVTDEDDALLSEQGVDKDDDWVGIGATCGEMRMESERLRLCRVRGGECLNELDKGEVADCLGTQSRGDLDGHWYAVVIDLGLEFVCVPGYYIGNPLWLRVCRRERVPLSISFLLLADHLLELFHEHVLRIGGVEHKGFQPRELGQQRQIHGVESVVERGQCLHDRMSKVLLQR
ncbi:hypothetical protein B5807_11794 [Epicoccum nigrum]|uniref:Uncharacterized protein n=1 Tax=Epicoccum nigrum TaxID=105696 RepID=A0A1Y2LK43_EPING|nr:hypothetical protein B5807_11794 [Epicoccum nigrum]